MKKYYVIGTCIPDNLSSENEFIKKKIKEAFYLENKKQNVEVIFVNYNEMANSEASFKGTKENLKNKTIMYIDTLLFTPESFENSKTRKNLLEAINIDSQMTKGNTSRIIGTEFVNLVDVSELKRRNSDALSLLYDNVENIHLVTWDKRHIKGNLRGSANSRYQVRKAIQTVEKNAVDIARVMFNNLSKNNQKHTINHLISVAMITEQIAKEMKLSKHEIDVAKISAVLHDFGKQFIPSEVINSPKKLTEEEFNVVKNHTVLGALELLNQSDDFDHIINTCLQHHERPDGRGYPLGLKSDQIDPIAKIVSVADAFQAMLGRCYQKKKSIYEIRKEIEKCSHLSNGRQQFDENVGKALLAILSSKEKCKKIGITWDKNGNTSYSVKNVGKCLEEVQSLDKKNNIIKEFFLKLQDEVEDIKSNNNIPSSKDIIIKSITEGINK